MNFWLIADAHLGHRRLHEEALGGRPVGFEELILDNLSCVKPEDVLIDLGDVAIYQHEYWHARYRAACKGKMIMVRGNHDSETLTWFYKRGWDCVVDEMKLEAFGRTILFTHKPVNDRDDFDVNVHGHFHNLKYHPEYADMTKHRVVCMEHSYEPIDLRRLLG